MIFIDKEGTKQNTAVALGMFDGIHLGHRAVLKQTLKYSEFMPTAMTFATSTDKPQKKRSLKNIISDEIKFTLLEEIGIKQVYSPDFIKIKDMDAAVFFQVILKEKLKAKVLICGEDFRFGKKASGNVKLLQTLGNQNQIDVEVVPPYYHDGILVSSTVIRKLLQEGKIEQANALLGYSYCFQYEVIHGRELGRTWGFPTINQRIEGEFVVPKFGVYASKVLIDGNEYYGVTDIGVKPTVSNRNLPLAETHVIGIDKDLYGQRIKVSLLEYLREEKKFLSIESLISMIQNNISYVKEKYIFS